MAWPTSARRDRLAELTVALSLATDLGTGQPLEHGLRTCWLSLAVAEALGLDAATRSCVYHVALLRFLGCTSDASETAALAGGDDVALNAAFAPMLNGAARRGPPLPRPPPGRGPALAAPRRPGRPGAGRSGRRCGAACRQHCEVGPRLAARLGMATPVCDALAHAYERWDGKGLPRRAGGRGGPASRSAS